VHCAPILPATSESQLPPSLALRCETVVVLLTPQPYSGNSSSNITKHEVLHVTDPDTKHRKDNKHRTNLGDERSYGSP